VRTTEAETDEEELDGTLVLLEVLELPDVWLEGADVGAGVGDELLE